MDVSNYISSHCRREVILLPCMVYVQFWLVQQFKTPAFTQVLGRSLGQLPDCLLWSTGAHPAATEVAIPKAMKQILMRLSCIFLVLSVDFVEI